MKQLNPKAKLQPGFHWVPGYELRYSVNQSGIVLSHYLRKRDANGNPTEIAPYTDRNGYKRVILWKNNKGHGKFIHGLVLLAFVGPCPAGMECDHEDRNRWNNNLSNLRWLSIAKNRSTFNAQRPLKKAA